MPVWKDEVFGPVLTLSKFKDLEEVVQRANDTPYGLAAGIFSQNTKTVCFFFFFFLLVPKKRPE